MSEIARLKARKRQVLEELAVLDEVRMGSIVERMVKGKAKDGTPKEHGPYLQYSRKRKQKTESRYLSPDEAALYGRQIAAGRRFKELMGQLQQIGERIADLAAGGCEGKKKRRRRRVGGSG